MNTIPSCTCTNYWTQLDATQIYQQTNENEWAIERSVKRTKTKNTAKILCSGKSRELSGWTESTCITVSMFINIVVLRRCASVDNAHTHNAIHICISVSQSDDSTLQLFMQLCILCDYEISFMRFSLYIQRGFSLLFSSSSFYLFTVTDSFDLIWFCSIAIYHLSISLRLLLLILTLSSVSYDLIWRLYEFLPPHYNESLVIADKHPI